MAESSRTTLEATLFERTLPIVPGLADRLEGGIDLLDVGCGQGIAVLMLTQRFQRSRVAGIDIAAEAIAAGRAEAERLRLTNAEFIVEDAASSPPEPFRFHHGV